MRDLDFYIADLTYVTFLRENEEKNRGFSRVPNLQYSSSQKKKFFCGIVLSINDFNYFVPVSSYKKKQRDNFLIKDKELILGSLRFNYMIPIPMELYVLKSINDETDEKYKILLNKELSYCNLHKEDILYLANRTYKRVLLRKDLGLVHNSCDFKFLEKKCLEYQEILENSESINYEFYLNLSDKTLDR